MNIYSKNIYIEILLKFPSLNFEDESDDDFLLMHCENLNAAEIGGIAIRTTVDNSIWIQNHLPNSSYSVDSIEELEMLIEKITNEKIFWVIAYKNGNWYETTLTNDVMKIEKEKNVLYKILSWSGKNDQKIIQ
jgi:hypothetical protein